MPRVACKRRVCVPACGWMGRLPRSPACLIPLVRSAPGHCTASQLLSPSLRCCHLPCRSSASLQKRCSPPICITHRQYGRGHDLLGAQLVQPEVGCTVRCQARDCSSSSALDRLVRVKEMLARRLPCLQAPIPEAWLEEKLMAECSSGLVSRRQHQSARCALKAANGAVSLVGGSGRSEGWACRKIATLWVTPWFHILVSRPAARHWRAVRGPGGGGRLQHAKRLALHLHAQPVTRAGEGILAGAAGSS